MAIGSVESFQEITERKRAEEALEESNHKFEALSNMDGLTGITNRRRFDEVLAQEYLRHALFDISNELLEAVLSARPATQISAIITRLLADVSQHFHDEESILETVGLPGMSQHVAEHTNCWPRVSNWHRGSRPPRSRSAMFSSFWHPR